MTVQSSYMNATRDSSPLSSINRLEEYVRGIPRDVQTLGLAYLTAGV
jgi:hypothetical protein